MPPSGRRPKTGPVAMTAWETRAQRAGVERVAGSETSTPAAMARVGPPPGPPWPPSLRPTEARAARMRSPSRPAATTDRPAPRAAATTARPSLPDAPRTRTESWPRGGGPRVVGVVGAAAAVAGLEAPSAAAPRTAAATVMPRPARTVRGIGGRGEERAERLRAASHDAPALCLVHFVLLSSRLASSLSLSLSLSTHKHTPAAMAATASGGAEPRASSPVARGGERTARRRGPAGGAGAGAPPRTEAPVPPWRGAEAVCEARVARIVWEGLVC